MSSIDQLSINTIRVLAADTVQKANSGHPGMPLGMAPAAHVLWSKIMRFNPSNAKWLNRDRFVLSNGHGCALLYILLHLSGFKVSLDDLKQFRQLDSITPGHPEAGVTDGVELTTGPLGQGISNAVGLAIAREHLAATFNKPDFPIFDNTTFVFCGDGCLMEGVASEACSLAGHLGLGNLVVIYDDNKISIDGSTELAFTENVSKRFEAYGWHVQDVLDGNADLDGIEAAIRNAKAVTDKPSMIHLKTTIGFLSSKEGTAEVHGSPLGGEDIANLKTKVGFNPKEFFTVPDQVSEYWGQLKAKGAAAETEWNKLVEKYCETFAEDGQKLRLLMSGKLPDGWKDILPSYPIGSKVDATRNISGQVLNALAAKVPFLIGGSADLTPSNKTLLKKCGGDFQKNSPLGRYIRFGVREHGMVAIGNGIAAYGGLVPFTASFFAFVTYCFPSIRLAALSHHRHILIMTHDSIGLGEDGPTHQPVEVLALCRATPRIMMMRPADGNEVVGAYQFAMEYDGPTVIALTRQNVPVLEKSSPENVLKGAYVVSEPESTPELIFIATGSEVGLAIEASKLIPKKVRVVSAPCLKLFEQQSKEYHLQVLPIGIPVVSVEASSAFGWSRYAHFSIGMKSWGASAPAEDLFKKFGLVPDAVASETVSFLDRLKKFGPVPLPIHLI